MDEHISLAIKGLQRQISVNNNGKQEYHEIMLAIGVIKYLDALCDLQDGMLGGYTTSCDPLNQANTTFKR